MSKPIRIANRDAQLYVQRKIPFQGTNMWGEFDKGLYVLFYCRYDCPIFIHESRTGIWYENCSDTLGKNPVRSVLSAALAAAGESPCVPLSQNDMVRVYEEGSIIGLITKGETE